MLDPSDVVISEEVDKVSYWSSRFGTEMTINSVSKESVLCDLLVHTTHG